MTSRSCVAMMLTTAFAALVFAVREQWVVAAMYTVATALWSISATIFRIEKKL